MPLYSAGLLRSLAIFPKGGITHIRVLSETDTEEAGNLFPPMSRCKTSPLKEEAIPGHTVLAKILNQGDYYPPRDT